MTSDEQKKRYRKALYVQPVERFTLSQIRSIHEASIKLLAETGMECAGEQAAGVYHSAGCRVSEIADGKQKRWKIQFPEKCWKSPPQRAFRCCARCGIPEHAIFERPYSRGLFWDGLGGQHLFTVKNRAIYKPGRSPPYAAVPRVHRRAGFHICFM